MNKTRQWLAALLLLVGLGSCATPQAVPFKLPNADAREQDSLFEGADEIAVYTTDADTVVLRNLRRILHSVGFDSLKTTYNSDSTRFLVSTRVDRARPPYGGRALGRSAVSAYFNSEAPKTRMLLSGFCVSQAVAKRVDQYRAEAERTGVGHRYSKVPMDRALFGESRHQREAFRQLEAIARAYPNGRVSYRAGWEREFR